MLFCSLASEGQKCARLGVVDLRGCNRESCVAYSRSTQVKLRRDLLLCVASVMYPSVEVFSYYGLEDDVVFNSKSVVYLVVQLCFAEHIKTIYRVHQPSFVCEVYGVHNVIHGADGVSVF